MHFTIADVRHDGFTFAFSVLSSAVLVFAFLLLIPLSTTLTSFGETGAAPGNLYILEQDALQPEASRIESGLAARVAGILGDRLERVDPVIFRILRVEGHPVQLRGVDPAAWGPTFGLEVVEGEWPAGPLELAVGEQAGRASGWGPGSEIEIFGQDFRVAAVVAGHGTKAQAVWIPYSAAHSLFGPDRGAQLLVAHLRPEADPLAAQGALEAAFASAGEPYDAYFEDALVRETGEALDDLRSLSLVTTVIALSAVTVGSANLAWLAAEERRRRLGLLRAVGFGRADLVRYFVWRGGAIAVAAYLLALVGAVTFTQLGWTAASLAIGGLEPELHLTPATAAAGFGLAALATLAGSWISAHRLLRTSPSLLLGRGPEGMTA